jgi:hypothetical protein
LEKMLKTDFIVRKTLEELRDRLGLLAHAPLYSSAGYVWQGDNHQTLDLSRIVA